MKRVIQSSQLIYNTLPDFKALAAAILSQTFAESEDELRELTAHDTQPMSNQIMRLFK